MDNLIKELKEFKKTIEEEWAKETGKITDEEESKMSGIIIGMSTAIGLIETHEGLNKK